MNRLTNLLTSPYFLALVISIIIIIFLPPIFNKYNTEITRSWTIDKENGLMNYCDLDNDGYSEQIILYLSLKKEPSIKIINHLGGLNDQWNFKGKFPEGKLKAENFFCGDFNNNDLKEIYFLSQYGQDSVYLNILETHADSTTLLKQKFITRINKVDTIVNYSTSLNLLQDINHDSYKEIIFCIKAGFSLQPRAVFVYDIINDILIESPPSASVKYDIKIADLNNDNYPELICSSCSRGNIHDSLGIPYSDHNAWLIIYDNKLNYFFEPISFKGYPGGIRCEIFNNSETGLQLYVLFSCQDKRGSTVKLLLFSPDGKKIIENDISHTFSSSAFLFKTKHKEKEKLFIINNNGKTYSINNNLKLFLFKDIKYPIFSKSFQFNLNKDKEKELIFVGDNRKNIIITQGNFDYPVLINIPPDNNYSRFFNVSLKKNGNKDPELFIQNGANCYLISYYENPLFYFKYLIYLGIFAGILILIFLIQKTQKVRLQKRIDIEKQIFELQFISIKGQMDPHFTFNALNSISSLIYKEEKETAYNFISKFSALIRATVENSDKIDRTINEELDFVSNYLELQKFRFNDKFDYEISIASGVETNILIPQMIIQNFVENAIKHGLKFREKDGMLKIDLNKENKKILITIEDNGIGREKAKEVSIDSTGKGLSIIDGILDLYFKLKYIRIKYQIEDLFDKNNDPAGTKVLIEIPLLKTAKM
ncbi:MAG: histidine kinase [Bacteroidales bacterium]|nr:histidine kinase [Bacteroidales bacterium]